MTLSDLKPYGDLISVCGALLIFFSWLTTNTLGERFKSAKAAYETASDKRRLYNTLDDIRHSTESVAAEINILQSEFHNLEVTLDARRDEGNARDRHEYDQLRFDLTSTSLNARQIDWGYYFCGVILQQPERNDNSSAAHKQLLSSCDAIQKLLQEKDTIIDQMNVNYARYAPSGAISIDKIKNEHQILHQSLRNIIHHFGPLLKNVVQASNSMEHELREHYSKARARSVLANHVAFFLYIIGTILVIAGSVISKLIK